MCQHFLFFPNLLPPARCVISQQKLTPWAELQVWSVLDLPHSWRSWQQKVGNQARWSLEWLHTSFSSHWKEKGQLRGVGISGRDKIAPNGMILSTMFPLSFSKCQLVAGHHGFWDAFILNYLLVHPSLPTLFIRIIFARPTCSWS